jgi:hypothetical protein
MFKRQRLNEGAADVPAGIHIPETSDDAVAVIRSIMNKFNLDSAVLDDDDSGLSLSSLLESGLLMIQRRSWRGC